MDGSAVDPVSGGDEYPGRDAEVEALCVLFHDAYEAAAVAAGWETQERSRKPWADVPEANKETMRATCRAVLAAGYTRRPASAGVPVEAWTAWQIRDAYARHASPDDWGVPAFYENGLIAALRGKYDSATTDGGESGE